MSNFQIETIFNGSVSTDTTTKESTIQECVSYGVQIVSTNESSFSTTITLEESLDSVSWAVVPDSSQAHSGNDTTLYSVTRTGSRFVRVNLGTVSGSADVEIKVYAKGN